MLRNYKGKVLIIFSKHVGVCDSNEVEVLVILEALRLFNRNFFDALIVESDSSNVITWAPTRNMFPRKFPLHFNEIGELSSSLDVVFYHDVISANAHS